MANATPTDMSNILENVERDLHANPPPTPTMPLHASRASNAVEHFTPQKYRSPTNAGDSFEQLQQDFRKAVADLETRAKALVDELKRITG